ncbi:MAG: N-acetylmuramic acid 6-phosphate etherase [Candidatus Melainabacteria bacterium]|nr:N-acetylmuramic acid 6-phosphate etherase [Candidatus Melainabacteria bacterium]
MKDKNNLDLMSIKQLVELFLKEEQKTINILKKQKSSIVKAINLIKEKTGRVIYIGAGTSGRLGILDAAECKPTFSTNTFQAIIAGGKRAIFQAKEGAEDSTKNAIQDLKKIKFLKNDVLIGISASGETPYTVSAMKKAKKIKATTIAITSNPNSTLSKTANAAISPNIHQEIISDSSRLKSGTAQKIILNMISSITMIKRGKVYNNLMIDVQPRNKKLVNRAIRIISNICKVPLNKATTLFKKSKSNTKAAIVMHFKKCDLQKAKLLLKKSNPNLRKLIG